MNRITIGLDFGTHQTKVCVENKADVNNPIYSFFQFVNEKGDKSVILPSIVQINKDDTLSYGFVDHEKCKYGKKIFIGNMPSYPNLQNMLNSELPLEPSIPSILDEKEDDISISERSNWKKRYNVANRSYNSQMQLWRSRCEAIHTKYQSQEKQIKKAYNQQVKDWYKWQNAEKRDYKMIYRYFKQSTFSDYNWNCNLPSNLLSVWYLSYIIFKIEEKYGNTFAIQMGIPTGSDNFLMKKKRAVSLLLTAYYLVEEVFQNNINKFLETTVEELTKLTVFVPYSEEKKIEYSLLIFPEAYAGLKSLTNKKKIETGMSVMVDIGGGTTDITFFTVEDEKPIIYNYTSIPLGLNYIGETANPFLKDKFESTIDLNLIPKDDLIPAIEQYYRNLKISCDGLVQQLRKKFERINIPDYRLKEALENRAVIYSGGGSTYPILRKPINNFSDIHHISPKVWEGMSIEKVKELAELCPIISTSLGLSISEVDDNVRISSIEEIFQHLENITQEGEIRPRWI